MLSAAEVALLASQGITQVHVHRKPVVGSAHSFTAWTSRCIQPSTRPQRLSKAVLLSTAHVSSCVCSATLLVVRCRVLSSGDELVECTDVGCPAGCVRDSNRPLLLSLLSSLGCAEVIDLGIVRDTEASLSSVFSPSRLRSLDCVVCTGGVSMGELDLLKGWLTSRGRILFGRVNMKPGKPTTFAVLDRNSEQLPDLPFFALPGNPVSAFATCHLFVLPALQHMSGVPAARLSPDSGHARCAVAVIGGVPRDSQRVDYHRCSVYFDSKRGGLVAISTGNQQSSRLMSAAHANAMLVLQPGEKRVQHGEVVDALLIERVRAISGAELSTLIAQSLHGQSQQQLQHNTAAHPHHHLHHQHCHSHHPQSAASQGSSVIGSVLSPVTISVAVVTVSDRVSSGHAQDGSGPAIEELLQQYSNQRQQSVVKRSRHLMNVLTLRCCELMCTRVLCLCVIRSQRAVRRLPSQRVGRRLCSHWPLVRAVVRAARLSLPASPVASSARTVHGRHWLWPARCYCRQPTSAHTATCAGPRPSHAAPRAGPLAPGTAHLLVATSSRHTTSHARHHTPRQQRCGGGEPHSAT